MNSSRLLSRVLALSMSLALFAEGAGGQSSVFPTGDVQAIYKRLRAQIDGIRIFDHHAHPGFGDDPDVDAQAAPPTHLPYRQREDNPEILFAVKSLFDYPYQDMSAEHMEWLSAKSAAAEKAGNAAYFDGILDKLGIEASVANRVSMPGYLNSRRFRWVFFVDSFLFPFDNKLVTGANPDEGVYIPLQEKMLRRYMQQAGMAKLPDSFDAYLAFVTRILEENRKKGGIAEKFEVPYFRSLYFADPPRDVAASVYAKYRLGGVPSPEEYTAFQDFVFRYLVVEGGRLSLPVHIHTAVGIGDYFSLRKGDVLNLENVLRDPRYTGTTFVLVHGGYPYYREAIWLAAMKNVFLDSSEIEGLVYPYEFKNVLRFWLETYPEKITFGTDAFPYSPALGSEATYALGVYSAREALAAALAEMVASNEVTEATAVKLARGYLHDNAAALYPWP